MIKRLILSLFDYSGNWSLPYRDAGHCVIMVDIKHGVDVLRIDKEWIQQKIAVSSFTGRVDGILAAPPCTDFSGSGAQYWPAKDADGRTAASLALIDKTLEIVEICNPDWWALENPVGRLNKLRPALKDFGPWYWQPHWFGDAYTKKTGLWGKFNHDLPMNYVEPVKVCEQVSWLQKLGGKSEKTKTLRSATPMGFARAFYEANHWS